MYCLWIGGKKVNDLKQLKANFDLDSVEIYCLGGGLARWLRQCGEIEIAEKIEKIDTQSDLSERLAKIFDQPYIVKHSPVDHPSSCIPAEKSEKKFTSSFAANNIPSEGGSFTAGENIGSFGAESSSYELTSFGGSSFESTLRYSGSASVPVGSLAFEYSSFVTNSFNLLSTSFNLFTASFNYSSTSFMTSSFHEYEYEYEAGGSFSAFSGSYSLGSFRAYMGSFTDTSFVNTVSSYKESILSGVHRSEGSEEAVSEIKEEIPQLSPHEKVLKNIAACPLNRFGYGIHLI